MKFREYLQEKSKYWEGKDEEYNRLVDTYIPRSGASQYFQAELMRAASGIMYDWYNNGWGVNNYTGSLEFLHKNGYFKKIRNDDLASGGGRKFENYMDEEMDKIVKNLIGAETNNKLIKNTDDSRGSRWGLSSKQWDDLVYGNDDEDDY